MRPLKAIYQTLYAYYGDLHWWPADSPFEVMVGAVLTQNTAWTNVEKAIRQFEGELSPERVVQLSSDELEAIIRPAGFYRQKAQYLKAVSEWFLCYDADPKRVRSCSPDAIRSELLAVRGVGNETADSILLYAFDFPAFVIDAYTIRLFQRIPLNAGNKYMEIKRFCEAQIPKDAILYNRFHALIVENAKEHCRKKPLCDDCPLANICAKQGLPL
uniref:endonuclease III domain-containing protein n=1 Tax=Ndongobacter massiliensis TaxID=1871025 RepID=UPI000931DAD4|nr:endonuclease III domain-containing protein [Ndongobacter massiliensis]